MRVPVLIMMAFAALLGLFYELHHEVSSSFQVWTEVDSYALRSFESKRCFPDEAMVCTFMLCSGRVTGKLRSNELPQASCAMGVRYVKRNLIGPEAVGVTLYPDRIKGSTCEQWR